MLHVSIVHQRLCFLGLRVIHASRGSKRSNTVKVTINLLDENIIFG